MAKTIKVKLSSQGIDEAIKAVDDYRKWFEDCSKLFLDRIANYGCKKARINFGRSGTAGTNDVTVSVETVNDKTVAVVAKGTATLFIEFGTGIKYTNPHPEADELGMIRGEYGFKQGANPKGWYYSGEAGQYGEPAIKSKKGNSMHTYGQPASMAMYNAKREIEMDFERIAKECFK